MILKTQGEWKIQITMASNFFPSKDSNETRIMRSKSGVIKTMTGNKKMK